MNKVLFFTTLFCLMSVSALAQKTKTDFSGTWSLDVAKSKLDERARIESMTLTVAHTDNELKVTSDTKRQPPPADAPRGGMGRGFGGGDSTIAYSLDGKETIVNVDGPMGPVPVKYKAAFEGGKASLSSTRTFSGPMGEVSITTKETWALSEDGKILTVVREQSTPRGSVSSTMVFTKK